MEDGRIENHETFFARMRALFSAEEVERIRLAYVVAKGVHHWQVRKELGPNGEPLRYFEHLRAATLILVDEVGCEDPEAAEELLLHDSDEDTNVTLFFLEVNFGKNVARNVGLVSKNPKAGYLHRLRTHGTWKTFRLKACDRLHNLRTLGSGSFDFRRKQLDETVRDYYPLFDRMVAESPEGVERERMTKLRRLIHEEVARQEHLLLLALAEARP